MLSDVELMSEFQGLGDNTEFGLVQRECGAEPFGLFRFSCFQIGNIIDVLETRLVHLFTEDDLEVFEEPGSDQFISRSRHYKDFAFLTLTSLSRSTLAAMQARELKRTSYLKGHFLDHLAGPGKIFVRKGSDSTHDLRRLQRALANYGPHVLLIVVQADVDHPAGTVEWLDQGLLRGYVSGFRVCGRPDPIDLEGWLRVCRAAYRMHRPETVYTTGRAFVAGDTWTASELCEFGGGGASPSPPRRRMQRLTHRRDTTRFETLASCNIAPVGSRPRETILFSAWVWIPDSFRGEQIDTCFVDLPTLHSHPVDLARRNCWQRSWVTAAAPRDNTMLVAVVRSGGARGASIYVADWTLETGTVPRAAPTSIRQRITIFREAFERREKIAARRPPPADPTPDWFRKSAETSIARGAFVEADDVLSKGLVAFPNDAMLAKLHAMSAHNSGRYSGAISRWARASELAPDDPMCVAGMASNLREHLVISRAVDVIERALGRFPDDLVVLSEGARIAEAAHRPADALKLWDKAISLHGAHPEWLQGRDRALSAIGNQSKREAA